MAISREESDGKEESLRDCCCTAVCDKSYPQNAPHSCTPAAALLRTASCPAAPTDQPLAQYYPKEAQEQSTAAASSSASLEEDPPSPSPSQPYNEVLPVAEKPGLLSPEPAPSPSHLQLPPADSYRITNRQHAPSASEYTCETAEKHFFADEQALQNLPPMGPSAQSASSSQPPTVEFSSHPPATARLQDTDQDAFRKSSNRHSSPKQNQARSPIITNDAAVRSSSHTPLLSASSNALDPNAREFVPSGLPSSSPVMSCQQKIQSQTVLHSHSPSQASEIDSLNHQMARLNLEVGPHSTLPKYEHAVDPSQVRQNHVTHEMSAPFYSVDQPAASNLSEAGYYMGFHQKPGAAYENHGYGIYQAASQMGFPVVPGGVLARPEALHNAVASLAAQAPPPAIVSSPTSPFVSIAPAGLMETQLSGALRSQRQYAPQPFTGYGGCKEHVSRALLISGLPPHQNEAQVRAELERWGSIRAIQAEVSSQGFQLVTVQFFDLRAARQALRDMQSLYQQTNVEEQQTNSSYKQQSGAHMRADGLPGYGRRVLLCGNVVLAQYITPWNMQVPDSDNQGTLVLFNVGADVNMQDLHRVFEAYGNVREVREAPTKRQHKFVEFYDTRSAAAAMAALNGQDICGRCVKIEFSRQGGSKARRIKAQEKSHDFNVADNSNAGPPFQGVISMDPFGWPAQEAGAAYMIHGDHGSFINGVYQPGWEQWLPRVENFSSHFPLNACVASNPNPLPSPNAFVHIPDRPALRYGHGSFSGEGNGAAELHHHGRPSSGPRRGHRLHNFEQGFRPGGLASQPQYCAGGGAGVKERHVGGSRHLKQGDFSFKFDEDEMYSRPSNPRTTLMIQNIPNKYSQKMLLSTLDQHCAQVNSNLGKNEPEAAYDFMYLPIDFKNKCNLGYAFANFTTPQATVGFYKAFHGKAWEEFNSRKICGVAFARLQGRSALEEHFKTSHFTIDVEEYLPVMFVPPRNGVNLSKPRVAVAALGLVRVCRTAGGNGGHGSRHRNSISSWPNSSSGEASTDQDHHHHHHHHHHQEQDSVLSDHSHTENSSTLLGEEEVAAQQETAEAIDLPPPADMGV